MAVPCDKCFCFVYDTLLRPLPPSDPFYKMFKFKRLRPIASELTHEIIRTLHTMGNEFYINPSAHKELVYSSMLCVEAGFAHCNRNVSIEERKFNNPLSHTHLYLQKLCTSLKMELGGVHTQHCGLIPVVQEKEIVTDDDDLYA